MKGAFKLAIYWLVLAIPFTQAANLSAVANPREPKWGDDNVCEYFLSVPWYLKAENWVDSYVVSTYVSGPQGCNTGDRQGPQWSRAYYPTKGEVLCETDAFICKPNKFEFVYWLTPFIVSKYDELLAVIVTPCRNIRSGDVADNCDKGPDGAGPHKIISCCKDPDYYDVDGEGILKHREKGYTFDDPLNPGQPLSVHRDMQYWFEHGYYPKETKEGNGTWPRQWHPSPKRPGLWKA